MIDHDHQAPPRSPRASGPSDGPLLIRKDQDLFSTIIDQSNDAIFIVDPGTARVLYVNDKARSNLRYPGDELLGMRITDFAANVPSAREWADLVQRLKGSGAAVFETEQRRRDGSMLPVEVNVRLVTIAGREFMVSVARDTAERKQAERMLREERNKLEAVMSAIGDGITVQDRQFRILYQNAPHREKQGDHVGELCYRAYQRKDAICAGCLLAKSFVDGQVHRRETSAVTDRGVLHMEVSASALRNAEGEIVAGIEVVRDITARKSLEAQLLQAQKMEAVGQLAGGVAHDFNNILTAIMGYGNLLLMSLDNNDTKREFVDEVLASADRAAKLTRSLLTFSRKHPMELMAADLNIVIRGVDKLLRSLAGEHIELRMEPGAGALPVMADVGQIEQVLMNLVANARDAMPRGGRITIRTVAEEIADADRGPWGLERPGRYVVLSVSDTGAGMDEETQKRIFDPFFTTKEQGRGTGLGLSIVYGIVRQHEGAVRVASKPGQGTTFTIVLPYREAVAPSGPAVRTASQGGTETVLLVEDESGVRRLLKRVLEHAGYRVIEAADGQEGLDRFLEARDAVRIVLTDVVMPKKSGPELYASIKAVRPDIRVLFMSGYSEENLPAGVPAAHYLPKPVAPDALLRKVRAVLESSAV